MKTLILLTAILAILAPTAQCADVLAAFPKAIAGGTIDGQARAYDSKTIIDYMDGGAEPYFRFAFTQLYQAAYKLGDKQATVEVFDMTTGPEAYGIYSMDLEGRKLSVGQRALYMVGTFRCWQGRYFIKIYSTDDTPEFRAFATAWATHFAGTFPQKGAMPALCSAIPSSLKPTEFRFFHECDDLNAVHYVSTDNVLELDKSTSMVLADCTLGTAKLQAAVVRYPSVAQRDRAWSHFNKIVFTKAMIVGGAGANTEEVRKGSFTGISKLDASSHTPMLVLCFNAGSDPICRRAMNLIMGLTSKGTPK